MGSARAELLREWPHHNRRHNRINLGANLRPLLYGLLNIISASGIVFANKVVFQTCGFKFTCMLTFIHTLFTLLGMRWFSSFKMYDVKELPRIKVLPLAAAFVAYIVLCNLSLKVNTVGFYQVMKIAVAPTVIMIEAILFGKIPPVTIVASVLVVCLGIAIATVTDSQLITNISGLMVGVAATVTTALYQIWAGSKQKELKASSMQLLHQYTPQAAVMLAVLVPIFEPVGLIHRTPDTILGYNYTVGSVLAIIISAGLGLLVSLSTFLVIGATSSLTYNVVGHLKTIIILSGGCFFFGDSMPPNKLFGVGVAMLGIIWYTQLKLQAASAAANRPLTARGAQNSYAQDGYDSPKSRQMLPTTQQRR
jgi:solute carrier family 35 protein E3